MTSQIEYSYSVLPYVQYCPYGVPFGPAPKMEIEFLANRAAYLGRPSTGGYRWPVVSLVDSPEIVS